MSYGGGRPHRDLLAERIYRMSTDRESQPTPAEWNSALEMLLQVQRTLAASVVSGTVEEGDHHIVGLPSGVEGSVPGGSRIEAALHAVTAARHLVRQAAFGTELPGVPTLQRAQHDLAVAGGYVAATWNTELSERVDKRPK